MTLSAAASAAAASERTDARGLPSVVREPSSDCALALDLRQVGMVYPGPPEVVALQPFDLRIVAGTYVTVAGPSGSGKSTFLNIAGLLDRPTAGRVVLNGVDVTDATEAARAAVRGATIGFVFQGYHLIGARTARENVMLAGLYQGASRRDRESAAVRQLRRVGLEHRIDARADRLSGGEKQRVAIARATASDPGILLCDEPTGNLDSASARSILELLRGLNDDGMTVVVVTHDPEIAAGGRARVEIRDGDVDLAFD